MSLLGAALVLLTAQAAPTPPQITATLAEPSAEAMDLARTIARNSIVASLVPLQTTAEINKMIADNPALTDQQKERLRAIGRQQADAMLARFVEADARAHAMQLSLDDLRTIAAYESSPAATRRRAAMPAIIQAATARLGDMDFGKSVRAAFCAETGKLCN